MLKTPMLLLTMSVCALAGAQLKDRAPGDWDISVRYPRFSSAGPLARAANAILAAREQKVFRGFRERARKELPSLKKDFPQAQYGLTLSPHRITDRPTLVSAYIDRYDYLGGAHGTSRFEAYNWALVDGKVRAVHLQDLFQPGTDAAREASRALVAIMKSRRYTPSNVASGEWTHLTREQMDRFVVGTSGVLFLFDQYDLGAGAEGARKVLVPFSKLPHLDRRGVLRALFR